MQNFITFVYIKKITRLRVDFNSKHVLFVLNAQEFDFKNTIASETNFFNTDVSELHFYAVLVNGICKSVL